MITSYDNFAMEKTNWWVPTGFMFDLGSVMIYSSYAASSNGDPTMTLKDGSTFSEPARASTVDILEIQVLFKFFRILIESQNFKFNINPFLILIKLNFS